MVKIPWIKTPAWRAEVSLDQLPFVLDFRYNTSAEAWFMDILLRDETVVVGGVKMVQGAALLQQHIDDRLPPGEFVVVSSGVCGCAPDYDEMGSEAALIYASASELINAV